MSDGIYIGRILQDHMGQRSNGSSLQTKTYSAGQTVRVRKINLSRIPSQFIEAFEDVDNGYVINSSSIHILGLDNGGSSKSNDGFAEAEVLESKQEGKRRIIKKKGKETSIAKEKAKEFKGVGTSIVNGAAFVGVGCVIFALWKKKNVKMYGIVGGVIGGVLGKKYFDYIKD